MAVTRAARRLMGAKTYRNVDFEVLKGLSVHVELENVYDDFCVTSEEYELLVTDEKFAEHRVVNEDDLKTYYANVKQTYEEARDVYIQLKCENDKSQQNETMAPLATTIKRDMSRMKSLPLRTIYQKRPPIMIACISTGVIWKSYWMRFVIK